MSRFIAFDVETPNSLNNRMSAIGITVIENDAIIDEFYSLVNPETCFDAFNVQLTGISEKMVRNAPTFSELWSAIEPMMSGGLLVAHNAVFDLSVLKTCLRDYGIEWKPYVRYVCTVQTGRRVLPGMSHRLNVLCDYYGINLNHHYAASDSHACAEILLRYIEDGADIRQHIKTYSFREEKKSKERRTSLHDIWNPWHGCKKCSEGCRNCYMYYLDSLRDKDGAEIYKTKAGFQYPLSKDRSGQYKVKSGEMLRVCMTSDFFLEEADAWREEAWQIIHRRPDVKFFLLTKRPERVADHLPDNWGDGWENVMFNVTCENQRRADERIPILLDLPFKHKGIMCAPYIGPVRIRKYLSLGQIEQVLCDGENYGGARPCHYEWVKNLHDECAEYNVTFVFCGTGRRFIKDGKLYKLEGSIQTEQAYKSGLSFQGKPMDWRLTDEWGYPLNEATLYKPYFGEKCQTCGMKLTCNGCSRCGKCK